jgi:hypothetical protein
MMLWQHYVFRRGAGVEEMWDRFFSDREIRLLYIGGRGFDPRAQIVLRRLVTALQARHEPIAQAEQLLVGMNRYELDSDLRALTEDNAQALSTVFSSVGATTELIIDAASDDGEEVSTSNALRAGTNAILSRISDYTDVILDVSSLPRVAYLAILTGILQHLVPDKRADGALFANGVNFQVLVAEDSKLDSAILSEDPNAELVTIPGFSVALYAEGMKDWPMVWLPILGENRLGQLNTVMSAIPDDAEICPIVPHPSKGLRRAERLLTEYQSLLIDKLQVPTSNLLYVSESNPFEAYRQLLGAMERYRTSLRILGGCRLAVTPLSSKLVTLGAGMACFEMNQGSHDQDFGITIPYAEPMRYVASKAALTQSRAEVVSLILTGSAYE